MLSAIFNTVIPIFICVSVGYVWAKRNVPYDTNLVTRLVTNVAVPCLIVETFTTVDFNKDALMQMGLAAFISTAVFAIFAACLLKILKFDRRIYLPAMIFPNTGNIGLSICLLIFGPTGLALGIGYFTVSSVLGFIFGPAITSGNMSIGSLLRVPLVWATLGAIFLLITHTELPVWFVRSLELLGKLAIPMMLITLGVSLADLKIDALGRSISLSVLRLGMGVIVGWGLAELMGFEGTVRGVLIIQCAMPVAVFNYLFAQMYKLHPAEVAGTVFISTVLSFLTLPALLWFVMS